MGLFKRKDKAPVELSARRLAERLHDAGRTDQQIADAIGASRAQVTKIRNGQESGTLLRPRLLALAEGRAVAVQETGRAPTTRRLAQQQPRRAPAQRLTHAVTSEDIGAPVSIGGHQFGWLGLDGRPTKRPLERGHDRDTNTFSTARRAAAVRHPQHGTPSILRCHAGRGTYRYTGASDTRPHP
jgi:transcriptional regulator with XRE-family HTH domain